MIKNRNASLFRHAADVDFLGTNYYQISTQLPSYYYNFGFMLSRFISLPPSQRNAYTINFAPSSILIETDKTSAFDLSTVMVDNFFQSIYYIEEDMRYMKMLFEEEQGDETLSAMDLLTQTVYQQNQWFPASATMRFFNNGDANFHTINLQMSTNTDSLFRIDPISFILNKDREIISLNITEFDANSALIEAIIFPNFDPENTAIWNVSPSNNITLTSLS